MRDETSPPASSSALVWTGRVLGGLPALFMLVDGGMKLFKPPFVVEATTKLGYPESCIVPLGVIVIVATILYLIPRTAALGAILLTGYLGGAVATHVRESGSLFEILFPALFGALLWGGLCLRDERVRARSCPCESKSKPEENRMDSLDAPRPRCGNGGEMRLIAGFESFMLA